MPQALALAHDFADGNQKVVEAYKQLIDDGFDTNLADALALEHERAWAYTRTLSPDHFAQGKVNAAKRARAQVGG